MTDPFRPDDELVSAVLDGEATADERARVEGDPVLSARLAEFRAIRDDIAAPVGSPDHQAVERAIDAAKVAGRAPAPVVPMHRRRKPRSEVPRILATAAAVLLVLGSIGFLASKTGGDDSGDTSSDAAAAPQESGDDAGGESGDAATDETAAYDAEEANALTSFNGADLGAVADQDNLRVVIEREGLTPARSGDSASTPTTTAALEALQPDVAAATRGTSVDCQVGLVEADAQLSGGVLAQATATFADTPAVVYVYGTPEGRQRIVVVSAEGCRVLATFDL